MKKVKRFFSYVPLTFRLHFIGLKSAWEYKASFLFQVGGMAFNDLLLFGIWIFFFSKFQEVNGWTIKQTQLLFSIHVLTFVFGMFFFGGVLKITKEIAQGSLDQYLIQPRSVLWRLLTSDFRLDIVGDFVFGVGMLIFVCATQGWIYLILVPIASILSAIGMVMIAVSFQSIGFWVKRFERASWHYFWAVESPGFYPQNSLVGGLRVFLLTAVPSIWIISFPYYFAQDKSWMFLGLVVGFNVFITTFGIVVFRAGLKHYESGNLVTVNN